jgi:DNA-binding transcriptional LysR family regulator
VDLMALRTFQAVVEEGGILAASRKLNTVQSNVTGRIRKLEEELGAELFHRQGRGLTLAPPGRVLLDYARKMLLLERQTSLAVRGVGDATGDMRIGSMETFAALHLPKALKAVRAVHPGLRLHVQTGTSAALAEMVIDHKLDCAFIAGPVIQPELQFEELVVEELVQVRAAESDPASLPLILFREGCAYRARALAWQRMIGHAAADIMEFGTLDGILGCVAVGLGWTLMPRRVVEQSVYAGDLAVTTVPDNIGQVATGMVYPRELAPMSAMTTFCEAITQAA